MPLPRRKAAQLGMPMFLIYDLRVIRAAPPFQASALDGECEATYLIDRRLLHRATTILRSKAPSLSAKLNADILVRYLDDIILDDNAYEQSFDAQGVLIGERLVIAQQALDGLISLLCEEVAP